MEKIGKRMRLNQCYTRDELVECPYEKKKDVVLMLCSASNNELEEIKRKLQEMADTYQCPAARITQLYIDESHLGEMLAESHLFLKPSG